MVPRHAQQEMHNDRGSPTLRIAIVVLQIALAAVLSGQAAVLVFHEPAARELADLGCPNWVRLLLGWAEISAGVLFLFRRTVFVGGWGLILVLIAAATLHIVLGKFPPLSYLVYVPAILVVMTAVSNTAVSRTWQELREKIPD